MPTTANIKIRYVGSEVSFTDIDAAIESLSKSYRNSSISLIYPSGKLKMSKVAFLDVLADGSLTRSYGACQPVSTEEIKDEVRF